MRYYSRAVPAAGREGGNLVLSLMKKTVQIFFCFLLIFVINAVNFSQDSTRKAQDTIRKVQDTLSVKSPLFILSDYKYSYINQTNPDTLTRKRFLWYPAKNFEDIFNYIPGYYLNYMDVGQLNPVRYNQFNHNMALLRNGRPLNDMFDGSIDYNLLSRNEISEIEINNGFGNILYSYSDAVNLIQRQVFQNRPVTEISFINDRYENLFFDGNFHQNLFRNFNLNFGITKHSYDGKYRNSDFDKWLGRLNLTLAVSPKLNFFAYFNYAKIQKGLNSGLTDTVNLGNKDVLFDPQIAVSNSDAYEKKERFDIDAGAVFLAGKHSFTRLQLFVSNSFRQYRDEENRLNSNGFYYSQNTHWVNYGVKLQQVFNFRIFNKINVVSRSEGEFNRFGWQFDQTYLTGPFSQTQKNDVFRGYTGLSLHYKNITTEAYYKEYTENNFKTRYYTYGLKGGYTYNFDSLRNINFFAQFTSDFDYITAGLKLNLARTSISASLFNYNTIVPDFLTNVDKSVKVNGLNLAANLRLYKFDFDVNFSANFERAMEYLPKYFGNANLSFHDMAFKNKLEYKIGFSSRGWTGYKGRFYSGSYNSLFIIISNGVDQGKALPSNATLDFFVMGKIGRATFGLTMENILNRLIFNTGIYPNIDRGGLANVISRFNITWSFFD